MTGPCAFQFTFFDNLIEKTNTDKYYGEFNYDISDSSKFHIEALYSYLDMPHWQLVARLSPELAVRSGSHHSRTTIRA